MIGGLGWLCGCRRSPLDKAGASVEDAATESYPSDSRVAELFLGEVEEIEENRVGGRRVVIIEHDQDVIQGCCLGEVVVRQRERSSGPRVVGRGENVDGNRLADSV